MSEMLVVRHGQARLFTDDYDRLSEMGVAQARRLAERWVEAGVAPDYVWSGTLTRQAATADAVAAVYADRGRGWPVRRTTEALNEYPADAILDTLGRHLRERDPAIAALADSFESATGEVERYRHFHRLLVAVMDRWVAGDHAGVDLPATWASWAGGVREALADIMRRAQGGKTVAVFTSGGVIGVSVQTALAAPDVKAAELNWRIHNGSVTQYTFSGERVSLDRFNDVAHLPAAMLTYR